MPVALNPTGLPEWVGLCAALFSVVQLVFAPRRDLGSVTLGIAGAALILSMPEGSTYVAVAVAIALFVAAAAWFRAGKHGVGRPALN